MAKKKIAEPEDGLTTVAVVVGSALGKLARAVGIVEESAPEVLKKTARKPLTPKKKVAAKKVSAKRASLKKAKKPAKKA
jgi:hypothetical protein